MLLGTLGKLMNRTGEGFIRGGHGVATQIQDRGIVRAGYRNKTGF